MCHSIRADKRKEPAKLPFLILSFPHYSFTPYHFDNIAKFQQQFQAIWRNSKPFGKTPYLIRWIEEYFKFKKQQFELEDLRVMFLQSIRDLNLLSTLAAGYIRLTSSVHSESIYLKELKECSRRIYEVPKFIFYALGYAIERVLSMSLKGIKDFLPKKIKSQQLNLFEHFKIEVTGAFVF